MKRRKPNLNLYRAELDDIDQKIQELEEQVKADTTAKDKPCPSDTPVYTPDTAHEET